MAGVEKLKFFKALFVLAWNHLLHLLHLLPNCLLPLTDANEYAF